jgi:hypothetical protein
LGEIKSADICLPIAAIPIESRRVKIRIQIFYKQTLAHKEQGSAYVEYSVFENNQERPFLNSVSLLEKTAILHATKKRS